jgi:lysyl-tRNA synthetase class I
MEARLGDALGRALHDVAGDRVQRQERRVRRRALGAQGRQHHRHDGATGESYETPVTGGHAKLQWKPDWAMRWVALGVDYEMAGKGVP